MTESVSCRVQQPSNAKPASVYDVLMDFEHWSDWMPTIAAASWERRGAADTGVGGIRRVRVGLGVTRDRIVEGMRPNHHAYEVALPWYSPLKDYRGDVRIGPGSSGGPPTSPLTALPGNLSQGVLFNAPLGELEFGPNPLPGYASLSGAPMTTLDVQYNNGLLQPTHGGGAAVDPGGGASGLIPSYLEPPKVDGNVVPGTTMSVYSSDGTLLYMTSIGSASGPSVDTGAVYFNTGPLPFLQYPIYLSYSPSGVGTTVFDT
jgi:hypothetical protein